MESKEFKVKKGLAIQSENLKFWESVLKPEIYSQMELWIAKENKKPMKSGYDVTRGMDFTTWVLNLR
jgi:hypothetical protein